jgi:hypothetical protein
MQDGRHGSAYGKLTWRGRPEEKTARPMRGTLKKLWRLTAESYAEFRGPAADTQWPSLAAAALKVELRGAAAAETENEAAAESAPSQ